MRYGKRQSNWWWPSTVEVSDTRCLISFNPRNTWGYRAAITRCGCIQTHELKPLIDVYVIVGPRLPHCLASEPPAAPSLTNMQDPSIWFRHKAKKVGRITCHCLYKDWFAVAVHWLTCAPHKACVGFAKRYGHTSPRNPVHRRRLRLQPH